MCSGALGDRSKWRRKAEAFPARNIDRNPRRDAAEGPHVGLWGVKQDHGSTGLLGLTARPPRATWAPPVRPNQTSFLSLRLFLVSLSLSHFGPLWVLPKAQADRGLRDLRIKMSDLDQLLQTSPLGEANRPRPPTARKRSRSFLSTPTCLPQISLREPSAWLYPQLRVAFQRVRDKTSGKLRSPQR